jgi:hypothetical protein
MTRPCVLLFSIGLLCLPARAADRPAIADQIAKTYGLDKFGQVDAIRYTFAIDAGPKFKLSRKWIWEPKLDQVTYEGPGKDGKPFKVTYVRSKLDSEDPFVKEKIDPSFFNDQYWLLFPFHLVWDTGATVEDAGPQKTPLAKAPARKVVVKYPSTGGYLPGDTWMLFVGGDKWIKEFEFHRGGDTKPGVVKAKFLDYRMAGPLLVSLDHRGTADGKPVRILFSNVAVKVNGSSDWTIAK